MNTHTSNKTFIILAYLSLLPLLFALSLAIYHAINITELNGYNQTFSRLNAYIFSHSYAALLLCIFAGIQIGQNLQNLSCWNTLFNFTLLILAWLSYHSFADALGMLLLLCCWMAAFIADLRVQNNENTPDWYRKLKIKINSSVIIILSVILLLDL